MASPRRLGRIPSGHGDGSFGRLLGLTSQPLKEWLTGDEPAPNSCTVVQSSKRAVRGAPFASSSCCANLAGLLSPRLFKALSDPKRASLLVRLAGERGPRTVSHIADGSGVDLSVVSRHLAVLREAGVIRCVKQGKEVRCTVETGRVARLLRDLADALEACCPEESLQAEPGAVPRAGRPPGKPRSARLATT